MDLKKKPNPKHGGVWANRLVHDLEEQGISRSMLAGNTALDLRCLDQGTELVPFKTVAAVFERAAVVTGDDLIGFNRGVLRDFRSGGLIAYLGIASQNVADMLESLAHFSRVFSDVVRIDVSHLHDTQRMKWIYEVPFKVARGQYVEFGAAATVADLRRLTGVDFPLKRVRFHHHRRQNISAFEHYFGCEVEFGAESNEMVFKESTLGLALNTADEQLHSLLAQFARDQLETRKRDNGSTVFIVENEIARRLSQRKANCDVVSKDLGMSASTLARRLAAEGTSFARVLADFRALSATDYLENTDFSLLHIAFLLGYADVSSFTTAFKRWTGDSPAQYRKNQQNS